MDGGWDDDWVEVPVLEVEAETGKALRVVLEESGEVVWLPKSQIADAESYSKGDTNLTVRVTRWLAGQKGFI